MECEGCKEIVILRSVDSDDIELNPMPSCECYTEFNVNKLLVSETCLIRP